MSTPEPLAPEVRALVLATLGKRVDAEQKMATAEFSVALAAGVTIRVESPLGDDLGAVLRTKPKAEWRVTNAALLDEHLRTFPGCVETVTYLAVPGIGWHQVDGFDELAILCREHAPHLIDDREEVTVESVRAALIESKEKGEAAAPGIELVRPGGQLQVRPHKDAARAVERMVNAGLAPWDALIPAAPKAVAS